MSLRLDFPSTDFSAEPSRLVEGSLERNMEKPVQEYSGESPLKAPRRFLSDALRDLVASSDAAYRLFLGHIAQRYRYSSLGLLWAVAPSAIIAIVVTLGQRARVSALSPTDIPGQFYAVFGIILLQTFLEALNTQWSLFLANQNLLSRPGPHVEVSLLCGVCDNLFSLTMKMPLIAGIFLLCNVHPASTVVLGLVGMLVVLLIGTSIGLLLAPWSALLSDLDHARTFIPWILFATTPVFVEPSGDSHLWSYLQLNPLTWLFGAVRNFSYGHATSIDIFSLFLAVLFAVVFVPAGWLLCRIARPYVLERTLV